MCSNGSQAEDLLPNKPKRVVVVDDNRDAADSLAMLIKIAGHLALVAYDTHKGFQLAHESSPDIIFHDIGMPIIDGYAAARRLRSDAKFKETLLVAVTAYDSTSDRKRSLLAGFDLHLAKPVDFDEIKLILDQHGALKH